LEIEPHLVAEYAEGAGAVAFAGTVGEDVSEELAVCLHCSLIGLLVPGFLGFAIVEKGGFGGKNRVIFEILFL
jgi:hypothetical protein